jgi:Ca2+-binding RTX toxin-like protein
MTRERHKEKGIRGKVAPFSAALLALLAIAWPAQAAASTTVTVAPADPPTTHNCWPFGGGGNTDGPPGWKPYMGFVYQNLPAFELKVNDVLAFDLNSTNETDVQLLVEMARTTVNGGDAHAQPFTKVVSNTQIPLNPHGDTTIGNYELQFRSESAFSFPGGGLIIRFSSPAGAFLTDDTCGTGELVAGPSDDPSGFFVKRFYNDGDGAAPYALEDNGDIGAFRLQLADPPPPTLCRGKTATVVGTSGSDTLTGTAGKDVIAALGGKDTINGAAGNDLVCAGRGNDKVNGGRGRDKLLGQAGRDNIAGGGGNDSCSGGAGRDKLRGGGGNDKLKGGAGGDVLLGGGGIDVLAGGPGPDLQAQ